MLFLEKIIDTESAETHIYLFLRYFAIKPNPYGMLLRDENYLCWEGLPWFIDKPQLSQYYLMSFLFSVKQQMLEDPSIVMPD